MTSTPDDQENPFAAPRSLIGDRASASGLDADGDAELIRRHHLPHESSIKSVGLLCYLGAAFGVLVVVGGAMAAGRGAMDQAPPGASPELMRIFVWVGVAIWGVIAAVGFAQGFGLRGLHAWARWSGIALTAIAIVGSLFCGLIWSVMIPLNQLTPVLVVLGFGLAIQAYVFYLLVAPKSNMVFSSEYRLVIRKTPEIRSRSSLVVKIMVGLVVALLVLGLLSTAFR